MVVMVRSIWCFLRGKLERQKRIPGRTRIGQYPVYILLAVLLPSVCASHASGSDETERISCFVMGIVDPNHCPLTAYFKIDPLFRYSLYPIPPFLFIHEKQKLDRVYFPRTREILISEYDMIIFSDPWIEHFTTKRLHDLDYVLREGGVHSFGTFSLPFADVWMPTILYYTVPITQYYDYARVPYRVAFRREREPVLTPFIELGMEKIVGDGYHVLVPREGATTWADVHESETPWLVSWRPGGSNAGIQWVCSGTWDAGWWGMGDWWETRGVEGIDKNPYAIDMVTNLILYSLDLPLIGDIHARRGARHLIQTFHGQKSLILSMMEWADSYGADVSELYLMVTELEGQAEVAARHYLDQDYPAVFDTMESITARVEEATAHAVRLKNEALFWIYVIEWISIGSVSCIAGVAVWALMIRRQKYHVVESTRLRQF